MSKVRINDLARELEVKSKDVLDALPKVGITEKKTHSGSVSDEVADRVRKYFRSREQEKSLAARRQRPAPNEIKTKIDLSHISRPGDVLKVLLQKQQRLSPQSSQPELPVELPEAWRPVPGQPIYRRSNSAVPKVQPSSAAPRSRTSQKESPRLILPQAVPLPVHTVKGSSNGVKLGTSESSKSQQRSPHQDAIEQAEQVLKTLRIQEQHNRRGGNSDS